MGNKSALITGASKGIGKAIAVALAKEGYNLHLICKNNISSLNELSLNLSNQYKVICKTYQGDVSDSAFIKSVFSNISSLDVLVNNAGISYVGLLNDMSDDDWNQIMNTNVNSVFYTSREAIKIMLKNKQGSIINISSVWGNCGASMEVAYSASKGAVNSLTKALAKELAPSGITVNAIACGYIDTSMNNHLTDEEKDVLLQEIPADRFGQPEDIAEAVISTINNSRYMTGQIITVDGGWT